MKLAKIILLLILFLLTSENLFSQDTNIVKYLPLKVGNVWVYRYDEYHWMGNSAGYDKYTITGTIQYNGKTYFTWTLVRRILYGIYPCAGRIFQSGYSMRVDSNTGNIHLNTTCNGREFLVDSLKSRKWDTIPICEYNNYYSQCTDTASYNIFGSFRPSKKFVQSFFESSNHQTYVKGIGLYAVINTGMMQGCYSNLLGCIIDGVMYGDTNTLVGIQPISTEIPNQFSLSQNYPNPFNPSTKIRFTVTSPRPETSSGHPSPQRRGEGGEVKLIVFDMLGREVATLVNENLKAGTYEVDWNADKFASGVYYYQLTADPETSSGFKETKKMVLMK